MSRTAAEHVEATRAALDAEKIARLSHALRELLDAIDGGGSSDLHCGLTSQPDKPTYCFTHHESYPCIGEDTRKAIPNAVSALEWGQA